jgi:lipoate-protein ligase B
MVDFDSALFLQERMLYEISGRTDRLGGLIICEHPPMVTIGRDGSRSQLLVEPAELTKQQIEVRWLNRGGGSIVHGPGQLAVYPIMPLDRLKVGLFEFRNRLETAMLNLCRELKVAAWRKPDELGLWCRSGQFSTIGTAAKNWVSYHGMFVNVCPDLRLLRMVQWNRCGDRVTSLAAQRSRKTSMHSVRARLIPHLAAQFEYEDIHIYTGHPLLRRTKQRVHDYA